MKQTMLHRLAAVAFAGLFLSTGVLFANGAKENSGQQTAAQASQPAGVVVPKDKVKEVSLNPGKIGGKLEIFSWWSGTEAPALKALINLYEQKYPNVNVVNAAVAGGAGVNAKAVLKTRMLGGNPPGTFQVHAGQELIGTWVKANRMEDLTPLYKEEGWMKVFPKRLIDLISTPNGIWSVPATIHRANVLWYIPANLKKWGVNPPTSWSDFLNNVAPKLKSMGITPLSLGTTWTAEHLWEQVAISELGAKGWDDMWAGKISWTEPQILNVWKTFGQILKYTNSDASSLSWQQATDMVINGKAAFNVMGDWASGYLTTVKNLKPKSDFGWEPAPGTKGIFDFLSDSFGMPIGDPTPANTLAFLKLLGSKQGSDTLNPKKGSISPRLDSDLSKYNAYSQSAAKDFQNDTIVGSLVHGVVANEAYMNDFATVMENFLKNRDPQAAVNAAQAVAIQDGVISTANQ